MLSVFRCAQVGISGLIFLSSATAMCSSSGSTNYLIDVWTSNDDLPDTSVTAIAQTPDGYLWIGTGDGLARFDGVRFANFDPVNTPALKHSRVVGLFLDPRGTLWINTYDGSMTALRDGVFTHEWQGGQVSAVFSSSNRVFFALLRGDLVWREDDPLKPGPWQEVRLTGTTTGNSFRQDERGTLWYVTRDGVLGRVVGTNSEIVSFGNDLAGERVTSLAADQRGRIWVATDRQIALWGKDHFEDQTPTNGESNLNATFLFPTMKSGCWIFGNDKVRRCQQRQWADEVESWHDLSKVNTLYLGAYEDREGGTWFRHYGQGLFHAKPDGSIQRISVANGLPGDRVSCWFQDHEGNVWTGIDRGGLVRLREKRFRLIGTQENLPAPAVSSVCEDENGDIWIGTFDGGLNRWRAGALKRFDLPEGPNKASFFSAYPDQRGRLWLSAGREDLFALEDEKITRPLESAHGIKAMLVDRSGRLWMGRQNGLSCLTNGVVTHFSQRSGFGRWDVRALAEDREGRIWIGTGDGALYSFENNHFTAHRTKDGLDNAAIWSLLAEDDGTIWVGTFRGGLLRFKDGQFARYTTQSGLPSDVICQILEDGLGKFWIGSHKGIFYLPKSSFRAFDEGEIQSLPCISYGLYDGLPTLECSGNYQPSGWRGRDGNLWFATVKGLVSVRPDEVPVNRVPPPVALEEVLIDEKPIAKNISVNGTQKQITRATALEIPPGKHAIEFRYTALSYTAPDKVAFRYRLEGLDDRWVDAGEKRSAHYGPLRAGDYRFQVAARNNDGVWNEQGAVIALRVLPYFWETWWFKGFVGAVVLVSIAGTVRFAATRSLQRKLARLKSQRAIEKERERIAKDIHDDLGAGLTQIMLQSALARRDPPDQVSTHLTQISDTARELVGAMDEIVWAINPENDTLDGLVTYVGKFVQEYVTLAGLRCRLDLPAQLPSLAVSAEVRHNLFLAIRETLNNAIKHARAKEVSFQLKLQPAEFSFVIRDDGCGFAVDMPATSSAEGGRISSGHGLRNLRLRLEEIDGRCVVRSEPGRGTEVELTIMIQSQNRPVELDR
jgi:ligand-binding sensor domain-containing protein/signal transduction histidine kinase